MENIKTLLERSEFEEEKPGVVGYVCACMCLLLVVGIFIWALFFSHNIFIMGAAIIICVVGGIIAFFLDMFGKMD